MSVAFVNPEVAEKGRHIAQAVMEGGAAGWSTLIGKNVSYAVGSSDYGAVTEVIKPEETGETVVTTVDWSGDTSGRIYLLVQTVGAREVVAYMMALMLGDAANPDTTKLDDQGMDAYGEAVNSFVGQGAQQARGELGGTIKMTVGSSKVVDFSTTAPQAELDPGEYLAVRVKVTIESRPPFTMTMLLARAVTGVPSETDAITPQEEQAAAAEKLGITPVNLDIAMKIKLPLVVNIAAKNMRMELIQDMCPGTIIEFRKMSGENLDVTASNVKIATAEAVIINQFFGVQIRSIVDPKAQVKE